MRIIGETLELSFWEFEQNFLEGNDGFIFIIPS